jgi:hypothetical protein
VRLRVVILSDSGWKARAVVFFIDGVIRRNLPFRVQPQAAFGVRIFPRSSCVSSPTTLDFAKRLETRVTCGTYRDESNTIINLGSNEQ